MSPLNVYLQFGLVIRLGNDQWKSIRDGLVEKANTQPKSMFVLEPVD